MAWQRERHDRSTLVLGLMQVLLLLSLAPALAADLTPSPPTVEAPRLSRPPTVDDFLSMGPNQGFDGKMALVEGFIQRSPNDGEPATQRTEAYVGYDDKNLYLVFVCFDSQPHRLRARLSRRDDVFGDDFAEIMLDTFNDQRRGYAFAANAHGIQWEALWTEGEGFDASFDTLWHSEGRLTEQGYVVLMAIPFKSLRFPAVPQQSWGIIFRREIPRNNEGDYWPHISTRTEGRLSKAARLTGLENISPGRSLCATTAIPMWAWTPSSSSKTAWCSTWL